MYKKKNREKRRHSENDLEWKIIRHVLTLSHSIPHVRGSCATKPKSRTHQALALKFSNATNGKTSQSYLDRHCHGRSRAKSTRKYGSYSTQPTDRFTHNELRRDFLSRCSFSQFPLLHRKAKRALVQFPAKSV